LPQAIPINKRSKPEKNMTERVVFERHHHTAVITLNRPDKLNAWTATMRDQLTAYLHDAAADHSVSAVVVTGRGRGFCAGQDLAESAGFHADDPADSDEWIDSFRTLYSAVRDLEKPTIMAVNGIAAGSGFQFALTGDLRIGHPDAKLGQPELLSGIPSITGIWAMWSVLGRARTTELILTGRLMDGHEAASVGVLTELVAEPDVLSTAVERAEQLSKLPPVALALTKRRLRELEDASFVDAFESAKRIHAAAYATGEPQREMIRFLEKADTR
jgi:enoyl-CoA hydratase/carnithine racemase